MSLNSSGDNHPDDPDPTLLDTDGCIHQLFEAQVRCSPTAPAVIHHDQHLSYAALNQRANRLAHQLRRLGVGPDVLVALCVERSLDMAVGVLGILKAGGAYVPLDPLYPRERLAAMLDDAHPPVFVTQERLVPNLPPHRAQVLCLDTPSLPEPDTTPDSGVAPHNLAYVIYTSGSTGIPNGVLIEHRGVVNHSRCMVRQCGLQPSDRYLQFASISFDVSAEELFPTWHAGATVVLRDDTILTSFSHFTHFLNQHCLTIVDLPTSFWHAWVAELERGSLSLAPSLRLVIVGGEKALVERYATWRRMVGNRVRWINTYGPTETTIVSTLYEPDDTFFNNLPASGTVPIGYPIENMQTFVLDTHLAPTPAGEPGELYLGGVGVARGYLNRPDLTAQRFLPNPWGSNPNARIYKTGDLVRRLPDGNLDFLGRVDQQVKIRGFRVEPGEIETVLNRHPLVREAAVTAQDDTTGSARLVAYVVPHDSQQHSLTPAELRQFVRGKVPDYMLPSAYMVLERMPITPNDKIDYRALPRPTTADLGLDETFVAPRTPVEEMIAGLWSDVLGIERVGAEDSFVNLGGHSLHATQVVSRLRDAFQVDIPLRTMFETVTPASLAAQIESLLQNNQHQPEPESLALVPLPRDGSVPLPLSFAQQRLWFLEHLEADNLTYTFPAALHLSGPLNIQALRHSLHTIGQRHEILRTTFETHMGQPVCVLAPTVELPLVVTDLRHLHPSQRERELDRLLDQQIQQPYDLSQGPFLRTNLYWLDHERWLLLFTVHDIIADGWSFNVLYRELTDLYAAYAAGNTPTLPPLPVQYADVAHWQRQRLQGSFLDTQLAYWKNQLAGIPDLLYLPTDRPRPPVESNRGAAQYQSFPPALTDALKALSRHEGVTLFMTMLAAFATLLSRYSGQNDILVGSPIANRTRSEMEHLIGFFVNTLVFRVDTEGSPTFRDLLRRVRIMALDAYAHQDMPFENLVEVLHPERNLSYHPIFQVMFGLDHVQVHVPEFPGVQVSPLPPRRVTAMFDMSVLFEETPDGVSGTWEYATDLFDDATIDRMQQHYEQLLWSAAANPNTPIDALPMMSGDERERVLVEWNQTAADYPRTVCIHELFEAQAELHPQDVALISGNRQVCAADVNRRANQIARLLQRMGVAPEMPVGICMERSPELVIGLLAILKAGGAYVPLDPNYPAGRLAFMMQDAHISLLLTQRHLIQRLPTHTAHVLCLDDENGAWQDEPDDNLPRTTTPESVAYIIYTSGSTGTPKGVQGLHRASINRFAWMWKTYPFQADDICCQKTSLSFVDSVWEIFGPLLRGVPLVLIPDDVAKDPSRLVHELSRHHVTRMVLVPSLLQAMLESAPDIRQRLPTLNHWTTSGEALSTDLLQRFHQQMPGAVLLNLYGSSEVAADATCYDTTRSEQALSLVPIGRPIANIRAYILDQNRQPVPVGVPGELYLAGDGLARGYFNRPDLTAERFIPNPFASEPDERLYKTGDRVRYLPDGTIAFLGRVDQQVKLRGYRIEPGEIEYHLRQHPVVREAAVLVREERPGDPRLVAYVVPTVPQGEHTEDGTESGVVVEQVQQWAGIFDHYYQQQSEPDDPLLNIASWMSSYTGQPIPAAHMREWLQDTLAPIRARHPRRVLEIGCGTGMVLFQLAPGCEQYWGTDPAPTALDYIRQHIAASGDALAHVQLLSQTADDFTGIPAESFDAIILNSVVQYFPSIDYLLRVLDNALHALTPGGFVFLGDIRNLPLLKAFHTSVQLFQADPTVPREQLQQRVQAHLVNEKELVLDPAFFAALQQRYPNIRHVQILLKRGQHHNEMMSYRYNVLLHRADATPHAQEPATIPTWLDWQHDHITIEDVQQHLTRNPPILGMSGVPNTRVLPDVVVADLLESAEGPPTVADIRQAVQAVVENVQVEPSQFWTMGDDLGYHVELCWSASGKHAYDVLFTRRTTEETPPTETAMPLVVQSKHPRPWHTYANALLPPGAAGSLTATLRDDLAHKLPDYMVPSAFVLLDQLPLTPGGKVNYRALPAPDTGRTERKTVAPRTPTETTLAHIWAEVLGLEQVGRDDDFFALGGHSLQAMQLVAKVSAATQRSVFVRDVFLYPTIAALAQVIEERPLDMPNAPRLSEIGYTSASPAQTSETSWITIEHRPLLSLLAAGKLAPVDSASIIYLPPGELPLSFLEQTGVSREEVIHHWYDNMPFVEEILDAPAGRIAIVTLPRFSDTLYTDKELAPLIVDAIELAAHAGARVVSLAGLLPSATDYGRTVVAALNGRTDLPPVTTGHATTTATVVLMIERILRESGRSISNERVGFLGLGSVGQSSLNLALRCLPHPAEITLCDVYSKHEMLEHIRQDIREKHGFRGEVRILESSGEVPTAWYECSLMIGATNVPDVLDVAHLKPGTLIVDDSAPHCFPIEPAIQRLETQHDILFTEGGVLQPEQPIPLVRYLPRLAERALSAHERAAFARYNPLGIASCVISSLLSVRHPHLAPTIGFVDVETSYQHYQAITHSGFHGAALHCEGYTLSPEMIQRFRQR